MVSSAEILHSDLETSTSWYASSQHLTIRALRTRLIGVYVKFLVVSD